MTFIMPNALDKDSSASAPPETRTTMKAFVLERYGKKRALQLSKLPVPQMRDTEVLVQVYAAGVNLLDSRIRDGSFKQILPYRLPVVLGHDVAGEVVKIGSRVR